MGRTRRKTRARFWSGVHPGLPIAVDTRKFNPDSVSGQNSRRATNAERRVGQPAIGYLKRRIDTETAGGISHGSGPWLRPTEQIGRRSAVTLRRATQTGLRMWSTQTERLITDKRQGEAGTEKPCSSHIQLEMAVSQLQRDVEDCRAERELARNQTPADTLRPQRRSGYKSTPVPIYSRKSNWEQYREVFEAIVCVNGWDDVTAALQLLFHLDGDALNVALLVPEYRRVKPRFLIKSLSEHYNAPGRLAEYKRQFQRAFRRPGDDPSIFATELQALARRLWILTLRFSRRWCKTVSSMDRWSVHSADIWTVWDQILPYPI